MIKIVIDTNILISGTFWNGAPYSIIRLIDLGEVILIMSRPIFAEYDIVVRRDEIMDKTAYEEAKIKSVREILQTALIVNPVNRIKFVIEDPDDDKFIEAAHEGKADYIISRDRHLLKLKNYEDIQIITPEEFLRRYNSSKL